jgi:hypothetical protein
MPVGLWNDEYYDSKALYTGSATMVDGSPVIVYPGISDPPTGGTFNVARPADRADPLLTVRPRPPGPLSGISALSVSHSMNQFYMGLLYGCTQGA